MKKNTLIFMFVVVAALLSLNANAYDVTINGIYYNLNLETQTAEVVIGQDGYSGEVMIPESIEYEDVTYSVTSIGEYAFKNCKHLIKVTIPKSVTSIGTQAFRSCKGLSDVYCYAEDILLIEEEVFYDSTPKFKTLHVPDASMEFYENDAQWSTFGTILPLSVPEPDIVEVDGVCYVLNEEKQTAAVTRRADGYKDDIKILASIVKEGLTYTVDEIGNWAFNDCTNLTSITIPDGVTTLGYRAFWGCSNLASVDIPIGVCSIFDEAFSECANLEKVTMPGHLDKLGEFAFYGCSNLISIEIPEGVKTLEAFAFYGCSTLESIVIPNDVTLIGDDAFAWCTGLRSVTIPSSLSVIGQEAFAFCTNLSSMNIPEGVETIGYWSFASCWGLESVNLPSTLKELNYGAFSGCDAVTDVYCHAEIIPSTEENVFLYFREDATLHVPAASLENYASTEPWSTFGNIVALDEKEPEIEPESEPTYKVGDDITSLATADWEGKTGDYGGLANASVERYTHGTPADMDDILTQTVSGLENGTYRVQLEAAASFTPERGFDCPTGDGLSVVFANNTQRNLPVLERGWVGEGEQKLVTLTATVTDGTLKYGIKNLSLSGNWFVARLKSIVYVSTEAQSPKTYSISIAAEENGKTTTDVTADEEGSRVFITATPEKNCTLESLKVTTTGDKEVEMTNNSFIMPASAVTVTATYKVPEPDAIEDVINDDGEYWIFTIDGKPIETFQKGVYIIRYTNGTAKKVMVK